MKVIIPMAGRGTRLRPHTLIRPKPLLKVAGRTILEHIIDRIKDLKFSEVIFITNNQKEDVEDFVKVNYKFKATFIEQKTADGSAGAIRMAKDIIDEDVLIIFSDTLFDLEPAALKKTLKDGNTDGLIWVKGVEDYQRFGVVVADENGYITNIVEKPKDPISKLANIGAYYIKDYKLMLEGIEHLYANRITLNGEYFLVDAFSYMIRHDSRLRIASVKGWYDCGTLPELLKTNQQLLKRVHTINSKSKNCVIIPPVYIDKDVVLENSVVGPFVSIASGCVIRNSIVKDSIIDHDTRVLDAKLSDSFLGENVVLTSKYKRLNLGDYSEAHYEQ